MIIRQFVKFVVFIVLLHKKSVVNSKLKITIEKKMSNKMGEDVRGEMIWYVREDFFSYLLGDIDVLKWESFFCMGKVPKNSS